MEQYKQIPIVINNFNRLSTTRKLYKDLVKLGYNNIIILDNQSNYPPLLDWYRSMKEKTDITIEILKHNYGHKALWASGYIEILKKYPFIVYTDSDIELNANTPKNFIETLVRLSKEFLFDKVGLAIKIDDLPKNFMGDKIRQTESIYWIKKLPHRQYELYQGMIDTTFALINPILPFNYQALRIAGDFTCKHMPWYNQWDNLSIEEQNMIETANPNISTYIQHYNKWLETNGVNK